MFRAADNVIVSLEDGTQQKCKSDTPVKALMPDETDENGMRYLGALVNNDVVSLTYPIEVDSTIRFLTIADSHGWRIYRRSVSYLLAMTVKQVFPEANLYVEHSLGTGFYCNFEMNGEAGITDEQLKQIEKRMRELVEQDLPIVRRKIYFVDAIQHFEETQQTDKLNLLRFKNAPKVVVYTCDGFIDLAHGPVADSTAALGQFKLIPYPPGFVIQFPDREDPTQLSKFEKQPHLFQIFKEHKKWGRILGVRTAGDLNEIITNGEIADFVKIAEAFHEKKIVQVADHIYDNRDRIKWILIAGPSSSGKTTFAKRLAVQLRVNGLRPVTVSVDNYFVNREETPRDEKGNYDFEDIETIDLNLFNTHMEQLDHGKQTEIPYFNFADGRREFRGDVMHIEEDQMVLVEGIHSLNPRLTETIPPEHKFKIYISALTQLNLDYHNRLSTTENRLIRRMVRDHQFRGNPALETLRMWPSVRRGEKKWIFPYQQEADIAFNSALDYELAVLKPRAEPLLAEVKPFHEEYAFARHLMSFLSSFIAAPSSPVPPTSLLREFLGHSGFRY
jgi:uridine kinase